MDIDLGPLEMSGGDYNALFTPRWTASMDHMPDRGTKTHYLTGHQFFPPYYSNDLIIVI